METKTAVQARFAAIHTQMIALSHRIHAHPEIGFEEEQASTWLCEILTDAGFQVDKGICDLPTAFSARAGQGPHDLEHSGGDLLREPLHGARAATVGAGPARTGRFPRAGPVPGPLRGRMGRSIHSGK